MLCERWEEVLGSLGVELYQTRGMFYGPCPVHGGDNPGAINFYPEGDTAPGFWQCHTRHCEDVFRKTSLGFIRGVLSGKRGWCGRDDVAKIVGFDETVAWACRFLKKDFSEIRVDVDAFGKRRFASEVQMLLRRPEQGKMGVGRERVRARLSIPSPYFIDRGWSPEVLDRFDVGDPEDTQSSFRGRAVVPVYGLDGLSLAGCTGRSVNEICDGCQLCHPPELPCSQAKIDYRLWSKWRDSDDLPKGSLFYNWGMALPSLLKTGVIVVTEGAGDVWRLEEAGIHCGVALLGVAFTDPQQFLIEASGVRTVIVATDEDAAGRAGAQSIKERLARVANTVRPKLPKKDLGSLSVSETRDLFAPIMERYGRK